MVLQIGRGLSYTLTIVVTIVTMVTMRIRVVGIVMILMNDNFNDAANM